MQFAATFINVANINSCIKSTVVFTPTLQCEDGWTAYNGNCYYINDDAMSWHAARGWCLENGGDLASILTAEEQNFTMELVRQNNDENFTNFK